MAIAKAIGKGGKKRCYLGKSCGATCISKSKFCVMELGPELSSMLKQVRSQWDRRLKGSLRDKEIDRIEKLFKTYQNMPEGPAKERIKQRIQHIQNTALGRSLRWRRIGEVMMPHDPELYMRQVWEPEKVKKEQEESNRRVKKVEKELDESKSYQDALNRYKRPGKG